MTECYWLALARDIPYARYGQEPITTAAIADLRRFADHQGLDAHTLFRSIHPPRPARSPSAPPTSSTRSPARANAEMKAAWYHKWLVIAASAPRRPAAASTTT
jgi:hypothetical protein